MRARPDRRQGRKFLPGSGLLTGLAPRFERAANLGTRRVDGAPAIAIEKATRLMERQGKQAIGPLRRLQMGRQLLALARDPRFDRGVGARGEDGIGAAAGTAAIALKDLPGIAGHDQKLAPARTGRQVESMVQRASLVCHGRRVASPGRPAKILENENPRKSWPYVSYTLKEQ